VHNAQVLGALLLAALCSRSAEAAYVYDLEAVTGMFAGSTLTGSITLDDATAGLTVWNLNDASTYNFYSSYDSGLSFGPAGLSISNDVRFDVGIGAAVLTPVLPDASPGYGPDWRLDTTSDSTDYVLGIGHDLTSPIWNLVEIGAIGNLDLGGTLAGGPPAWRLVLRELPGDYNGNGIVDPADYTVWRDAVTAGSTSLTNDPTPGVVDETDFDYWRAHFGEVAGAGAGAVRYSAVPEPTSLVLALLAIAIMCSKRSATHRSGQDGRAI